MPYVKIYNRMAMCHRVKGDVDLKTKLVVYVGLMTAITFVMTRFILMPVAAGGYVHLGDSIIYLTAFLFGGFPAAFAGGVGGALSDLSAGYESYLIPTLLIKFIMGFAAAAAYKKIKNKKLAMTAAFVLGSIIMVAGYFVAESIMYGNIIKPLSAVPMNLLQAAFSVPIPFVLTRILNGKLM
jgi:uncharacterized membrane protein